MRHVALALVGLMAVAAGTITQVQPADASFHVMRVYAVMGGASGNANIQYVELRMADASQNLVAGHQICFFDAAGNPWARFNFPASVSSGADEASVLVGTSDFDLAWPAGSPDFTFISTGPMTNTTAIGAPDAAHPIPSSGGKVSFGDADANCNFGAFGLIDSVAYGSGYAGPVDYGTEFASDLPTTGVQPLKLTGPICHPSTFIPPLSPCPTPRDNSADYALADGTLAANYPRNNAGTSGPVSPDTDGDGIVDSADNCPAVANSDQRNMDNDSMGNHCDDDTDGDGMLNTADTDDDADMVADVAESPCGSDPLHDLKRPERLDLGGDDDGDGSMNEALPGGSSGFDCDGDGFNGTDEAHVFMGGASTATDQDPCGNNGWPSDLFSSGASMNLVNLQDVGSFIAPAPHLGTSPGDPFYDVRWDLKPGLNAPFPGHISVADIGTMLTGTQGNPPMLGGTTAFGSPGPTCPWAP